MLVLLGGADVLTWWTESIVKEGNPLQLSMTKPTSSIMEWYAPFQGEQHLMVTLGRESYISGADYDYGSLRAHVLIGRYTSIAHKVTFEVGMNHAHREITTYPFQDFKIQQTGWDGDAGHAYDHNHYQVIIGNDVWIGCHTLILGGVHIGNGAVIGAGAVVAKDVPPYAVVVGNPARIVKYRFPKDVIEKLQRIKWWYWDRETIEQRLPEMKNPEAFVDRYDESLEPKSGPMADLLRKAHADGKKVYEFLLDFHEKKPVWDKVLEAYLETFHAGDDVLLLLDMPSRFVDMPESRELWSRIEARGADAPEVVLHAVDVAPALDALPYADVLITGCTEASSVCVDFAESFGVEVRSGCDYASHLFRRD